MVSKTQLGQATSFDAIRVGKMVLLAAAGENPTSGWRNYFVRGFVAANDFIFLQDEPTGLVLQVVTPFVCIQAFDLPGSFNTVKIHHSDGTSSQTIEISLRTTPSIFEQHLVQQTAPLTVFGANDKRVAPSAKAARSATHYERTLCAFDMWPEICRCEIDGFSITCRHIRYTAVLIIDVASAQDIGSAVEECMRGAAAVAALAALAAALSGGSLAAAAASAFADVLKVCLVSKLADVISVRAEIRRDCV
jgi:hypothetical protein